MIIIFTIVVNALEILLNFVRSPTSDAGNNLYYLRYSSVYYLKRYFIMDLITLVYSTVRYNPLSFLELLRLRSILRATKTINFAIKEVKNYG